MLSFFLGTVFSLVIDYRRMNIVQAKLTDSFERVKNSGMELFTEKHELETALKDMRQDRLRYESFEQAMRGKLGDLESILRKSIALQGLEKQDVSKVPHSPRKGGVGGAEIECEPERNCSSLLYFVEDDDPVKIPSSQAVETEDVVDKLSQYENFLRILPIGNPLQGEMSSPYGWRKSPFSRSRSFHKGSDFIFGDSRAVLATGDGIVKSVKWDRTYGRSIDIDHGMSIVTRYAHLSKSIVRKGQKVHRGDEIGIGGSSGLSTGQHLHYEILINRRARNPERFINLAGELQKIFGG